MNSNLIIDLCQQERYLKYLPQQGRFVEVKKYMLDQNPELRTMYNENDDNTAVLYFDGGKAVIYSFTEEPKVIDF